MAKNFKIPRFYKTLLALTAVLGPMIWLIFTQDGQRRTDLVLMSVLGRPSFDAALESFTDDLTEARLRESFPDLELQCGDVSNPFGNRVCIGEIGSFNQYPASAVSLYFRDEQLAALKVIYQPFYHEGIRTWVMRRLARAANEAGLSTEATIAPVVANGTATWAASDGVLVLKDGALGESDEPALMWLSNGVLTKMVGSESG